VRSMRSHPRRFPTALVPAVVIAVAACIGSSGGTGSDAPLPAVTGTVARPGVTAAVAGAAPSPSLAVQPSVGGGPPAARLAAEGGEPVAGQLGTFAWGDGGSDSPWLPGSPLHVGAGERLVLALSPATAIGSWRARYTRAGAANPAGATSLGSGAGDIALTAPARGRWTVEIAIDFAYELGSASYFWRLEVE
jgi:hypothetical protein